jgi:preprotein translocase subunit SecA
MFEAMMMRFQEDTSRHLFRMQIIGPDGTPIETPEQLAHAQQHSQELQAAQQQQLAPPSTPAPAQSANGASSQPQRQAIPIPTRAPATTIDALEKEFQKKKQKELDHARAASSATADANGSTPAPRRAGGKVGRNDECPCGSGKKYKKCHGAEA